MLRIPLMIHHYRCAWCYRALQFAVLTSAFDMTEMTVLSNDTLSLRGTGERTMSTRHYHSPCAT